MGKRRIVLADKTALGELAVKALGPSAERLGKSLESAVETFICNPLDNWIKKAGERFEQKSQEAKKRIITKIEEIPESNRKDPDLSIVGPAIEQMKFDLDKDDLVEMFANLISNSFDSRHSGLHPAFASIISQLNTQDARLLKLLAKSYTALPIISVDILSTNSISPIPGYYSDCRRLNEYNVASNTYSLESVIDNLERLKLAKLNSRVICFEDDYKRVRENPAFQQMFVNVKDSMRENKFRLELTSFGRMFTMTCIS